MQASYLQKKLELRIKKTKTKNFWPPKTRKRLQKYAA